MEINDFKKRQLDKAYVAIYIVSKKIKVIVNDCIEEKELFNLIGITIAGKRRIIGIYVNKSNDNHFWIDKFEDIKARGCETIFFVSTFSDKFIERALKLIYPNAVIVSSIHHVIKSIDKFYSDSFSNTVPKEICHLFWSDSINQFEEELKFFDEKYKDNVLVGIVMNSFINNIKLDYKYSLNIRKLLFNYYFLRDYEKAITKRLKLFDYKATTNDIISSMLELFLYLEKYSSFTKLEWRFILNDLYEIYGNELVRYI